MINKRLCFIIVLMILIISIVGPIVPAMAQQVEKSGAGIGTKSIISGSVVQSQVDSYQKYYRNGETHSSVLTWNNPSNSLTLTILRPDGSQYGLYYDNYDGSADGRIPVTIITTTSGTWTYKVTGQSVSGTQTYSLSLN